MEPNAQTKIDLDADLLQALQRDQFLLHFQPQVNLTTGCMVGAEALLRWQHPTLGLVPPSDFLGLAEQSGLMVGIGEWVLREACVRGAMWQRRGFPKLRVAVNFSAVQFGRQDVLSLVAETLAMSGFDPAFLDLEITESGLLGNTEGTLSALRGLKKLGLQLSIDDFGMGYSCFSYVKDFPVDRLKVDRSFISNLSEGNRDAAIVNAITTLGRSLNIPVVAEGVETEQQLTHLKRIGCEEGQGFYFSQPLPVDKFESLLRNPHIFAVLLRNRACKFVGPCRLDKEGPRDCA